MAAEMRSPRRFGARRSPESRLPESGQWLGGIHSVQETLRAKPGSVRELWVEDGSRHPVIGALVRAAREAGVAVRFPRREAIDRVAPGRHQGVAARVAREEAETFESYLEALEEKDKGGLVLVALDQIQDPHNLGAIARSAANLGALGLVLPERRSSPVTPAAVQASAGAIQKLRLFKVANLAQALSRAREAGFWIYGADAGGKDAWKSVLNTPMILVIGSEGHGLRPLIRSSCDELVRVPQAQAGVASLNASCAASVLLYEIARQRALGRAGERAAAQPGGGAP